MDRKSVYIIGAGASKEANLPTGFELKKKIANLLDLEFDTFGAQLEKGDHVIVESLKILARKTLETHNVFNAYLDESWHIRDALPQSISIDNFIDAHQGNEKLAKCGKLAIVRSILDAEKKSLLAVDENRIDSKMDFTGLEGSWYISFFQLLTENCGKGELRDRFESVVFIVFNYDRCIEHFIYHGLINYYKLSKEEASELIGHLKIYHPYGSVGDLPWNNKNQSGVAVAFGADPNPLKLIDLADIIKTFTEGTDPESSDIVSIKENVCNAEKLIFLGFAFHKLNMNVISPDDCRRIDGDVPKCYATSLGISQSDLEVVRDQISALYKQRVITNSLSSSCNSFFKEFSRSLSF